MAESDQQMFPIRLRKEIVALLCLKALALGVIYFAFIAPMEHPDPDKAAIMAHLISRG
jgi:hypothetical protein